MCDYTYVCIHVCVPVDITGRLEINLECHSSGAVHIGFWDEVLFSLIDQWSPEIFLSPPPQSWGYQHTTMSAFLGPNSGPCTLYWLLFLLWPTWASYVTFYVMILRLMTLKCTLIILKLFLVSFKNCSKCLWSYINCQTWGFKRQRANLCCLALAAQTWESRFLLSEAAQSSTFSILHRFMNDSLCYLN